SRLPPDVRDGGCPPGAPMKTVCRAALLMAALMGCSLPALAQDDVLGRWATPGVAAVVELARCPDAATLCGTVRWLWDAVDEKGRSRLDIQNPESSLRSRPLVGVSILSGLARLRPAGRDASTTPRMDRPI